MAQDDVLASDKLLEKINASADKLISPLQAIAAFAHACMLAIGFRFVGFGEEHNAEIEFDDSNIQKLWTAESDSHTEFRYAHNQSAMQYVIKVSRMGIKTVILAMAIGVDKTVSLDVVTQDFTSAAFFPWTAGDRDVVGAYIGEHRVKELASLIKINILQKLINNISKEGYEENEATTSTSSTTTSQRQPPARQLPPPIQPNPLFDPSSPDYDPLRIPPRGPANPEPMPDFEDPYDLNRPLPLFRQRNNPLTIGSDDLNPHPNPYNIMGGEGGIGPMGLPRPQPGQGGMYMDIRGRGRQDTRPPGVPPGARWDPIGPGRGRGGAPNPFGGYGGGDYI